MIPFGKAIPAALVASVMLFAAPAAADSISAALAKAYQNNASLNAARAGVRVTNEGVAIARSGWRPTIAGSGSLSVTEQAGTQIRTGSFGVQIQQSLFDGFQTSNNVSAAEARVRASNESLRNTEQNILFNAAAAYMDVMRDRRIAVFRERNLAFLAEQVRAAESRFEVGEGTRTDVAQAQAQHSAAQAQLSAARAQVQVVQRELGSVQARIEQIEDEIRKSRVQNPTPGTVLATYVEPGEFVQPGQPLYKVADLAQMTLRAYVTGAQLAGLRIGEPVQVQYDLGARERATRAGRVSWIAAEAEFTPTPIQTREERTDQVYAVKVQVPNPDGALKIGMPGELVVAPPASAEELAAADSPSRRLARWLRR
jgi:biotin carboxyl carrier protein